MRVLIADKFPEAQQAGLKAMGFDVSFEPGLGPDELPTAIGDAHILIVRSTKVTAETIESAANLQLIIRAGAGTNTIDCDTAAARAIAVANCPGKNAIAVAELVMGLVISLDRHIPDCVADIRRGQWNKATYSKADGLFGRTLGVLGAGRIGREVLARARAFGMKTVAYDIALCDAPSHGLGFESCPSMKHVLSVSDVVCVHLPMTPETKHCVGAEQIALMKPGAMLVNASRGGIVDDEALAAAVESGAIRAACDVYEGEPSKSKAEFPNRFSDLPGFYGTHHIGASTAQAQAAVADAALEIVSRWKASGEIMNCVNLARKSEAVGKLVVRHLDEVGVLANVLDVLKEARVNVQEMQNTIYLGGAAASAKVSVERALTADEVAKVRACKHVLGVDFVKRA